MSVQQQQTAQKLKAVIALMIQILVAIMFSMSAFADTDIGTGWTDEVGAGSRDWGYNDFAGGYRTYMESEGGNLVSSVTDIYFADPNGEGGGMTFYRAQAIGNKAAHRMISYRASAGIHGRVCSRKIYNFFFIGWRNNLLFIGVFSIQRSFGSEKIGVFWQVSGNENSENRGIWCVSWFFRKIWRVRAYVFV